MFWNVSLISHPKLPWPHRQPSPSTDELRSSTGWGGGLGPAAWFTALLLGILHLVGSTERGRTKSRLRRFAGVLDSLEDSLESSFLQFMMWTTEGGRNQLPASLHPTADPAWLLVLAEVSCGAGQESSLGKSSRCSIQEKVGNRLSVSSRVIDWKLRERPWVSCLDLQFRCFSQTLSGELWKARLWGSSRTTGALRAASRASGSGDLKSSLSSGSGQLYHWGEWSHKKGSTYGL